jgi:hypothetical protein
MAQRKISELTAATSVGDSDLIPIVQSGVTKKLPASFLKAGSVVSHLKALPASPTDGQVVSVVSFYSGWAATGKPPVGGGQFVYSASISKAAHNGGLVISPESISAFSGDASDINTLLGWTGSGAGCWVRNLNGGNVSVDMFGANSGASNDTPSFSAACAAVSAAGGGVVEFQRSHLFDTALTVAKNTTLQGPLGSVGEFLPGTAADYDGKAGTIKINSAITVSFLECSALKNCIVIRKGLDLPFANAAAAAAGVLAFAGTALTVAGPDVSFNDLLMLGFNKAIYSSNFERTRCHRVFGDCTNGIDIRAAYDIPHVFECHFWPFTTVHQTWTLDIVAPNFPQAGSLLTRTGKAYQYAAVGDWSKITNCFSYGYQNGFVIDSCDNVQLIGCGTDSYSQLAGNTAVGYTWGGTSKDGLMLACQAASQGAGVDVNLTATVGGSVRIEASNFWKNDSTGVTVSNGRAVIVGNKFRENGTGITALAATKGVYVADNAFDTETTPMSFSSTALRSITIGINSFYNCVDLYGQRTVVNNSAAKEIGLNVASNGAGYEYGGSGTRGTSASPSASLVNDAAVKLKGYAFDGSTYRDLAMIRAQCQANTDFNDTPGMWIFSTTPAGSGTAVDRTVIYDNGNFAPLTDDAYALGIASARWASVWAANGTIQTSDARTKTEVFDSVLGLGFINALRPVSYKFIVGGKDVVRQVYRDANGNECSSDEESATPAEIITVDKPGTRTHWGLLSQEVKSVVDAYGVDFAGWVLTNKDDPNSQQALRYDQFIAPLIKAIQELSNRVDELEGK